MPLADADVLAPGAVLGVQDHAPYEIGREAAGKDDDQHRQVLPEFASAARDQLPPRRVRQRLTGGETVGEARAHHARERRHRACPCGS